MKHSIILTGLLVGVDFTKKGEFKADDGDVIKFDDSVKLDLNISELIEKQGIKTNVTSVYTLKIPVEDSIEKDVENYNKQIGKTFQSSIRLKSDLTFKTDKPRLVA